MQYRLLFLLSLFLCSAPVIAQQRADSVVLKTATGNIYGTLTVPKNSPVKVPVVIIIAGSGPTDRNGNNNMMMQNNSLRTLSDSLMNHGIASLRYDKRGIAASKSAAKDESVLRFPDYVNDVIGWIAQLSKDKRFSKIFVAGHSEGSLIGMLAVNKSPITVAGYVSIAGAGKRADELIMDQLRASPQVSRPGLDSMNVLFAQLRKDGHINEVPAGYLYQSLLRPSVQPYIVSWIQYDPAKAIAEVKVPTLIIQGNADMQVDTVQARLLATAKPDARLLFINRMNHIFKDAAPDDKQGNIATYYNPTLPIKTELVAAIAGFINDYTAKK